MAVYRFRVFIEDNHEIYRDIEVQGRHDIADMHRAIVESFGFQTGQPAEYVTSDSSWYSGDAIVSLDNALEGTPAKIVKHVNDPHQRFLCSTVSHKPVELALELLKILKEEEEATYPRCVKVHGDAPFYTQPPVKPMSSSDEEKVEDDDGKSGSEDDEPTDDQLADEDTNLLSDDTETSDAGADDGDDDSDADEGGEDDEDDDNRFSNFNADEL